MLLSGRLHAPALAGRAHRTRPNAAARPRPCLRAAASRDVEDVLAEANALLNSVGGGGDPSAVQETIDDLTKLGYVCDETGCVLVFPNSDSDIEDAVMELRTCLQGRGWRLGMCDASDGDDEADCPAVVAGPSWSLPLRESDLSELLGVLQQLRAAVAALQAQGQWAGGGGERPASRAKWQSRHILAQAAWAPGAAPAFGVEMTFRVDRRTFTAAWPGAVVSEVCAALDKLGANSGAATPARSVAAA
ncbi:MAG: hypothetical protein J3K34DRAFT_518035 [Monoraphidium minutum]|nr:MAG: hypothetical protein J3K34DRAFT_518035 [Monoraphidium minutum]